LNDLNKERIKFNTEIIKLLTLLFITSGGGGLALIAEGLGSITELIFGIAGIFFAIASGILAVFAYKNTLKKLRNEND
jgi:hypothetical protein